MKKVYLLQMLTLALLAGCASPTPAPTPSASSVPGSTPSTNPTTNPTTAPTAVPTVPVETTVEAETATRILAEAKYPRSESRGATGKVFVMMFSGGDSGSSASLELPALMGRYQVSAKYLNHPDSPEFTMDFGDKQLLLPVGSSNNTSGELKVKDFGVMDLSLPAGSRMLMTVGGNISGQENAWIGLDSFTFTPVR